MNVQYSVLTYAQYTIMYMCTVHIILVQLKDLESTRMYKNKVTLKDILSSSSTLCYTLYSIYL